MSFNEVNNLNFMVAVSIKKSMYIEIKAVKAGFTNCNSFMLQNQPYAIYIYIFFFNYY